MFLQYRFYALKQIFLRESLNTSDFWVAPNNANVCLYQQTLPIDSNLKTLTFFQDSVKSATPS